MLVQKHLNGIAKSITYGSTETMESLLIVPIIESLNLEYCKNKNFEINKNQLKIIDDLNNYYKTLSTCSSSS